MNDMTAPTTRQPPTPDVLVQSTTAAASYGPRVEEFGHVEPPGPGQEPEFWSVYEWCPSDWIMEGGFWDWRADCDTEDTARTLAEALTHGA